TENPKKKFESTKYGNRFIASINGLDTFIVENCTNGKVQTSWNINREWKEAKEPVTFMEAVESGKKVRVEHPFIIEPYELEQFSNHYRYFTELLEILGTEWDIAAVRSILLEGKFYIED